MAIYAKSLLRVASTQVVFAAERESKAVMTESEQIRDRVVEVDANPV